MILKMHVNEKYVQELYTNVHSFSTIAKEL